MMFVKLLNLGTPNSNYPSLYNNMNKKDMCKLGLYFPIMRGEDIGIDYSKISKNIQPYNNIPGAKHIKNGI